MIQFIQKIYIDGLKYINSYIIKVSLKRILFILSALGILSFLILLIFRVIYFFVICSIFKVYENLSLLDYLLYSFSNDLLLLIYFLILSFILFALVSYSKKISYILKTVLIFMLLFFLTLFLIYFYQFETTIQLDSLSQGTGGFSEALFSSALFEIPVYFYFISLMNLIILSIIIFYLYYLFEKKYVLLKSIPIFCSIFFVSIIIIWSILPSKIQVERYIKKHTVFHNLTLPFHAILENPILEILGFYFNNKSQGSSDKNKTIELKNFEFRLNTHSLVTHKKIPAVFIPKDRKYNIILYVLESTSQEYLQLKYKNREITPNLNQLRKNSFVSDNHYTHSPLSINAIITLLSSSYEPPSNKWVSTVAPHIQVTSLFEALNKANYTTSIFHSGELKHFYLKRYLRKRNVKYQVDSKHLKKDKNKNFMFDWGVDDRSLINPIVRNAKKSKKRGKPFFTTILPIAPHHPYKVPNEKFKVISDKALNKIISKKKKSFTEEKN